jgi:very-long-chain (3R)-3-hydroxyacyl-CoA dehydratase
MGPKDMYLILYNVFCCAGWALVLKLALTTVAQGDSLPDSLASVYSTEGLATLLTYSQSAALLEILHAAVGLVRSPVVVTALQVGSRIAALVAINASEDAQSKFCICLHLLASVTCSFTL